MNSYGTAIPKYQAIDFKVTWSPAVDRVETAVSEEDVDTDAETDLLLCDTDRTSTDNLDADTSFWKYGQMPRTDRMVGFSRMGIMLYNGLNGTHRNETGFDATEGDEQFFYDKCLTRSDERSKVLYANTITPCAAPNNPGSTLEKPGNCQG